MRRWCRSVKIDIAPWIVSDNDFGHQILSEDDIVEGCRSNETTVEDTSDDNDCEGTTGPSHAEATKMLERLLNCFEKKSETSVAELITFILINYRSNNFLVQCLFLLR